MPETLTRLAIVTIGQAPRGDVAEEILAMLGAAPTELRYEEFGALDGLTPADLALHVPGPREGKFYTRLARGDHVVVGVGLVARRLMPLLYRLDGQSFDLIVLISTGLFEPIHLRTPFVHAQSAVDAWISSLVMGECELGLLYPLTNQHRDFAYGTLIQNARAVAATGEAASLEDAATQLAAADLILMHSIGYTEAMAHQLAGLTRRPVVTARRILAGAIRLHLSERPAPPGEPATALRQLDGIERLTPRERDVLDAVLQGDANKEIGRRLNISHRTVEIHRARALAKLNAASPLDLLRRSLIVGS
jgi:protein AroM